jgi:hypothetical protein
MTAAAQRGIAHARPDRAFALRLTAFRRDDKWVKEPGGSFGRRDFRNSTHLSWAPPRGPVEGLAGRTHPPLT